MQGFCWEVRVMQENPYAPPVSDVLNAEAPAAASVEPVSMGTRFVNLVLDTVGYYITCFMIGVITAILGSPKLGQVLALVVMPGYYLCFEGLFGRTPGKMLTGTRVVTVDGGTPRFAQILGRTFARYVPFEPFTFFSEPSVGWHDRWSGTRVVKVR
jgi:uncharacterized RDD family membrane protein YckC